MDGIVTTTDGRPLPGVLVYGSESKTCCPFKQESTKTNDQGRFHLDHPGAVIHISAQKFRPQTFLVPTPASDIHISLEQSSNELVVPLCGAPKKGYKRLGWGKSGPQFDAPAAELKIELGKVDTDYIRHVVRARNSQAYMAFWLGPMAMSTEPDDDQFLHSTKFTQRAVVTPQGERIGTDSTGELRNGMRWRQTAITAEGGAIYKDAAQQAADIFDRIIDSVCMSEGRFISTGSPTPKP